MQRAQALLAVSVVALASSPAAAKVYSVSARAYVEVETLAPLAQGQAVKATIVLVATRPGPPAMPSPTGAEVPDVLLRQRGWGAAVGPAVFGVVLLVRRRPQQNRP